MSPSTAKRLIFLGPPGAGKSMQASLLAKQWQVPHIVTGNILRQAIADNTLLGAQAKHDVEAGTLVPDVLILGLMRERFGQSDTQGGWILDGFPRTVSQAQALDQLLQILGQPYGQVVYLDVDSPLALKRLREQHDPDESESTLLQRMEVFRQETVGLRDLYQRRRCLISLDGEGSVAEVRDRLQDALERPTAIRSLEA